ncbi:Cell wall assembly regulator [Ptychographa xylographoides]|nr:Cell wall assembly regulator [Ptychographa xylographoides]
MPLNQSRHDPLTSVATSAMESRPDLNSPYGDDQNGSGTTVGDGWPGSPGPLQSPTAPYSPGMRSTLAMNRHNSNESNAGDGISPGEIQMQSFQEGLPPPPPVSHSWKRIDRWVEDNYEELYDQLAEGCTQNDLNELEHELDCSLPIEVRESLQCHDGQERGGRPTGIIFGCMLLDCEEIVQEWKNWRTVNEEYLTTPPSHQFQGHPKTFAGSASSSSSATNPLWRQELLDRQDSQPSRAVQRAYAHPAWIPLARDWGGNNIAVDLAPGPAGKWGQIIIFGRDYDCKYVIARSWSAFLAMVADDIGSEKVYVDEETQELKLREFKAAGVEPAYLGILAWRMDRKYGRKVPKRKQANGAHPGPRPDGTSHSPYDSPVEERGRSPIRFQGHHQPHSASPRGVVGVSSPLSQVSEEQQQQQQQQQQPPPVRPMSLRMNTDTARLDDHLPAKLVEAPTPILRTDDGMQNILGGSAIPTAALAADESEKQNPTHLPLVSGLGVDGLEEMKSVAI